ncbi:hypothetical protein [Paenibacillus donghaensis]|uniref:Uncharacterized protein n=1 Tax=Paenibacillus donghaensis TaxID=414771 RepID=A0A2Z2KI21_9BACL|nr:hypothetical protein [Paenibacillus donghaensis]ASA20522.1 hypothetical protein B9T62_06725 [Paenibacillus donghaensis]
MNKRSRKDIARITGSTRKSSRLKPATEPVNQADSGQWTKHSGTTVYIGPSEEGADKEYVKRISGKVDDRKPSFA